VGATAEGGALGQCAAQWLLALDWEPVTSWAAPSGRQAQKTGLQDLGPVAHCSGVVGFVARITRVPRSLPAAQ
jgi:hypothetical protein